MKLKLMLSVILTFSLTTLHHPAIAAPKNIAECTSIKDGINVKLPGSFEELLAKRKCISYAAWQKFSSSTNEILSTPKMEIFIGPNTKPFYLNPVKAAQAIIDAFPKANYSGDTFYIYYNFKDSAWAKKTFQSLISVSEYENISRNQGNRVIENMCDSKAKSCFGSQAITSESGNGLVLLGVPNALNNYDPTSSYRFKTGMLEAHEYFHLLQDAALFGEIRGDVKWPPLWILEGGGEYVQNAVINKSSFTKYLDFRALDAKELYRKKATYTDKYVIKYLNSSLLSENDSKYDHWLSYNLGSRFIEILVALKGQDSLLALIAELGNKVVFAQAFENVYGISWEKAVPIIAKVVSTDIATGR